MEPVKKEWIFIHNMNTHNVEKVLGQNVTVKFDFNAPDCTLEPIITQFRYFLKACGWGDKTIEKYLGEE